MTTIEDLLRFGWYNGSLEDVAKLINEAPTARALRAETALEEEQRCRAAECGSLAAERDAARAQVEVLGRGPGYIALHAALQASRSDHRLAERDVTTLTAALEEARAQVATLRKWVEHVIKEVSAGIGEDGEPHDTPEFVVDMLKRALAETSKDGET